MFGVEGRAARRDVTAPPRSVVDRFDTKSLESLEVVLHGFERFGECPCQSVTSPVTRNGSRERYDFVGLPGYFLSVSLGSSMIGPVGSTV